MGEQLLQGGQGAALQNHLRLVVVASDDVADSAERRCLHQGRSVPQELDKTPADTGLDHGRDPLIGSVRKVGERPASIREHLHVTGVDEVRECAQSWRHPLEGRRRLAAAEVGERPGRIPHHGCLLRLAEDRHDRVEAPALEHEVTEVRRVAGNVPKSPDRLLAHVVVGRLEQLHKDGQGAVFHDDACLFCRARGDVREYPRRFELQVGAGDLLEKDHEARHHSGTDHLLDGGILLDAQELPELLRRVELRLRIVRHQHRAQGGDLVEREGAAHTTHACLHRLTVLPSCTHVAPRHCIRQLATRQVVDHALFLQGLIPNLLPQLHCGILAFPPCVLRVDALLEGLLPLIQTLAEARHLGAMRGRGWIRCRGLAYRGES
mmetsp:Transcript_29319/g.62346  ORF Transcript_29319/g.62346 Transcript_29319/m.62346 type:complete len:378 (+) Transcript_29319:679-1812(+)